MLTPEEKIQMAMCLIAPMQVFVFTKPSSVWIEPKLIDPWPRSVKKDTRGSSNPAELSFRKRMHNLIEGKKALEEGIEELLKELPSATDIFGNPVEKGDLVLITRTRGENEVVFFFETEEDKESFCEANSIR